MVCWGQGGWWKRCSSGISHPVVAGHQLFIMDALSSTIPAPGQGYAPPYCRLHRGPERCKDLPRSLSHGWY